MAIATALLVSLGWLAVVVGAPRWISSSPGGAAHLVATATYLAGSRICHQRPDRSFHLGAVPLPVCARCTGLYLGAPLGLAFALWRSRAGRRASPMADRASRNLLIWATLPTIGTVALEWIANAAVPPLARLAFAVLLGGIAAWVCGERLVADSRLESVR
jgi:uncharacterized membrane protein